MRAVIALSALLALGACASGPTQEQLLAQDRALCSGAGFELGTDGHRQCMLTMAVQRFESYRARQAAMATIYAPQPAPVYGSNNGLMTPGQGLSQAGRYLGGAMATR